jgi:hypothetical protein
MQCRQPRAQCRPDSLYLLASRRRGALLFACRSEIRFLGCIGVVAIRPCIRRCVRWTNGWTCRLSASRDLLRGRVCRLRYRANGRE